jgi:hypothetical protein
MVLDEGFGNIAKCFSVSLLLIFKVEQEINTGKGRSMYVPSPRPPWFTPQAQSFPSVFIPRVCLNPDVVTC